MLYYLLLGIIWYISPGYDLFIKMMTLDSTWSAITFLLSYFNKDITVSQIITNSSTLFAGSFTDRYICYIIFYFIHTIICIFFDISICYPLYITFLVATIPTILNKILLSEQYAKIRLKKEYYIKLIFSKLFATIIKKISTTYLHEKIKINHKELLPLIVNYRDAVNYFIEILKNVAIVLILTLIRRNCASLYYRMTKYFYLYKSGEKLTTFDNDSSINLLRTTIKQRQWTEFLKPNIYNALICLFNNQQETGDFEILIKHINYNIIKFFTIWTVSSLLNNIFVGPILSLCIVFYKTQINYFDILIHLGATVIGYLTNSIMLVCILCNFGKSLLTNRLAQKITKKIYKKLYYLYNYIKQNDNNLYYLITLIKLLIVGTQDWFYAVLFCEAYYRNILSIILILTSKLQPINLITNTLILYTGYELLFKQEVNTLTNKLVEYLLLIKEKLLNKQHVDPVKDEIIVITEQEVNKQEQSLVIIHDYLA